MKKFFISDLHFGHKSIITRFGRVGKFSSLDEMHEHIISKWNNKISEIDMAYIIGDSSFLAFKPTLEIMKRLNGRKILIRGNHDLKRFSLKQFMEMGFEEVYDEHILTISNGEKVLLKHYPYDIGPFRLFIKKIFGQIGPFKTYHAFYPVNKGLWLIHGHIHGGPKVTGKQINVNVETWDYKPVSESQIIQIITDYNQNLCSLTLFKVKRIWRKLRKLLK